MTVEVDKPQIGGNIGRKVVIFQNGVARDGIKPAILIGWAGRYQTQPIVEYRDGTREVLEDLSKTDWCFNACHD